MIKKRELQIVNNIGEYLRQPQRITQIEDKQYGLPIFWEIIQDRSAQANAEITQHSINCLVTILKHQSSQPVKMFYLLKTLENVLKGESVAQSVIVA